MWSLGFGKVEKQSLGAPDCVYNPVTRKYYLYTFLLKSYKMDGKEGPLAGSPNTIEGFEGNGPVCLMAVSDSPIGPFTDPVICDWPAFTKDGTADPSVLVDQHDDGSVRVYAYWGMKKGDRWAEIDPTDMHTIIDSKTKKPLLDRKTKQTDRNAVFRMLNNPALNNYSTFFEAASVKKIANGKYVFIYSSNERICALTYCYSKSPEGPWTYGGRIVDNGKTWPFGNNHGSIFQASGKWYVVYHKQTYNDYNRQTMIEPIQLTVDGDKIIIPEVEMTSQGLASDGLNAFCRYNVNTMCYVTNRAFIAGQERNDDGLNPLCGIDQRNTVVGFKYLNFGEASVTDKDKLNLRLNAMMVSPDAQITLLVVPKADVNEANKRVTLATLKMSDLMKTDGLYHNVSFPVVGIDNNASLNAIGGLKGQMALFMLFNDNGKETCRLKEYEFAKGNTPTPNPLRLVKVDEKITNGTVTSLPIKGHAGESIKLSVVPQKGYELETIVVKDEKGNMISVNPNAKTLYTPENFNFKMPNYTVTVSAKFTLTK